MNSNMIRPKSDKEDLLLSITKICETLIHQTHTRPQETLEFVPTEPKRTFQFSPPTSVEGSWMVGLTSLEVYKSIFNITEENNKFELYTDNFNEFSFEELKDELEEILSITDITPYHVQHGKIGPRFIEAYRRLGLEKSSTDGYSILIMGYARSPFRDFESYHRIVAGLDEDNIQLVLKQLAFKFRHFGNST